VKHFRERSPNFHHVRGHYPRHRSFLAADETVGIAGAKSREIVGDVKPGSLLAYPAVRAGRLPGSESKVPRRTLIVSGMAWR